MATETSVDYDRTKELKQFDDTKAGVKGLVDAGILNIPKIFVRPSEDLAADELNSSQKTIEVPIIDVSNIGDSIRRQEIVNEVKIASGEWGFFQVINHGIPLSVLDEMIEGIRLFNEQDLELKKEIYSRDSAKKVKFLSNFDLYTSKALDWKDTLQLSLLDFDPDPSEMPPVCRKSTMEYIKHLKKLGETLFELLSEALDLQPDYLNSIGCSKGCSIVAHYYPPCPQPELTLGVRKHADAGILTVLLQNHIGGLQVLHDDQWFDVHLQQAIAELKEKHQDVIVVYGCYYNAFLWLLSKADLLGFDPTSLQKACCGIGDYNSGLSSWCGDPKVPVCENPNERLSWDGAHLTQRAYELMATWLVRGISPKLQCEYIVSYSSAV